MAFNVSNSRNARFWITYRHGPTQKQSNTIIHAGGNIRVVFLSFSLMFYCHITPDVLSELVSAGADKSTDMNQPELSMASRDLHEETSAHGHDRGRDTSHSPGKGNPEDHSNFNSDDDQLVIDERKQKRMISNRESARRSRLRKQQHLDELRSQVAHLRAENTHMLNRFSLASQQYAQLTDENCVLRSNAIDLRHQLQMLHHATPGHQTVSLQSRSLHPLPLNLSLCSGQNEDPNWG